MRHHTTLTDGTKNGRVMPQTLGMVVQREAAIDAFVARPFYTV